MGKERLQAEKLQSGKMTALNHKECYLKEKNFYAKYLLPGLSFCVVGANGTGEMLNYFITVFLYYTHPILQIES
jgi:hypothetical protein